MLVREAAAEHLEERQADWAYSRPVVALDLLWNLAFITVAAVVLVLRGTRTRPCRSGPGSPATPSSASSIWSASPSSTGCATARAVEAQRPPTRKGAAMDRPRPATRMTGSLIAVVAAPITPGNSMDLLGRNLYCCLCTVHVL